MKITICGSTAFINEMDEMSKRLSAMGHEVKIPPVIIQNAKGEEVHTLDYYALKKSMPKNDPNFWENHTQRIQAHFDKVSWSDAILVTNFDKNGILGYIGPNTLMEMGVAFYLKKPIFVLNPLPEVAWLEEILGMRPVVINGDLNKLK